MITREEVKAELERLRRANGGTLLPEQVVNAARPASSPLHGEFQWDNTEAAHQWRLHQARNIIRVFVTVIEADGSKESRAYVSLTFDRAAGVGYRAMADVLDDAVLRERLLEDARADMLRFRAKYAALRELAEVFAAIEKVVARRAVSN